MSARALRLAADAHLASELSLTEGQHAVVVDGRPPMISGQRFVGVHAGDWSNANNESLDEYIGLTVTITDRIGMFPFDRQGAEALEKAQTGLETFAEAVVAAIHSNYVLMNAANALIVGTVTTFVEPLRFRHGEKPTYRDGTWFGAEPEQDAGLSITVVFGDARRVQKIDDMDYEFLQVLPSGALRHEADPGLLLREDGGYILVEA